MREIAVTAQETDSVSSRNGSGFVARPPCRDEPPSVVEGEPAGNPRNATFRSKAVHYFCRLLRSEYGWWATARFSLVSCLGWLLATLLLGSVRVYSRGLPTVLERIRNRQGLVLLCWHGKSFVPIWVFRRVGLWAIISLSRDGEYQNRIFRLFGWNSVRGSSTRGGTRALREAASLLRGGACVAFTPDGPKGPPRKVQPGALAMAALARCPIIPVGIAASRGIYLRTWDRYMLPRPFSRAVVVFGAPIDVPKRCSDDTLIAKALEVERGIEWCEREAERLVGNMRQPVGNVE